MRKYHMIIASIILLGSTLSLSAEEKLRIGAEAAFPPFSWKADDGSCGCFLHVTRLVDFKFFQTIGMETVGPPSSN